MANPDHKTKTDSELPDQSSASTIVEDDRRLPETPEHLLRYLYDRVEQNSERGFEVSETAYRTMIHFIDQGIIPRDAALRSWVINELENWASVAPIPPALIGLLKLAFAIKNRRRDEVKNRAKYDACITFVARNPGATVSKIRKAIGYDQGRQIKKWLGQREFKLGVIKKIDTEYDAVMLPLKTLIEEMEGRLSDYNKRKIAKRARKGKKSKGG